MEVQKEPPLPIPKETSVTGDSAKPRSRKRERIAKANAKKAAVVGNLEPGKKEDALGSDKSSPKHSGSSHKVESQDENLPESGRNQSHSVNALPNPDTTTEQNGTSKASTKKRTMTTGERLSIKFGLNQSAIMEKSSQKREKPPKMKAKSFDKGQTSQPSGTDKKVRTQKNERNSNETALENIEALFDARKLAKKKKNKGGKKRTFFNSYMQEEKVEEGLQQGTLIKGTLRVNPRDFAQCWVTTNDGGGDLLVLGARDRNRALHMDVVVLKIKPQEEWVLRDSVYRDWQAENAVSTDEILPPNDDSLVPTMDLDIATENLASLRIESTENTDDYDSPIEAENRSDSTSECEDKQPCEETIASMTKNETVSNEITSGTTSHKYPKEFMQKGYQSYGHIKREERQDENPISILSVKLKKKDKFQRNYYKGLLKSSIFTNVKPLPNGLSVI
ncbi:rrp44-like cold shock domain-containing protein [Ditylenchus destructor]|uniref:Rrp44-like cold shock domain-containing protein n=1 Tax=Ditylenchus destructor TaxID=166010 RepID=A0AAD4MUY4_9BILA|nr:rrp44-like cold shock domain-containing protein [Ditylenchus destructor]